MSLIPKLRSLSAVWDLLAYTKSEEPSNIELAESIFYLFDELSSPSEILLRYNMIAVERMVFCSDELLDHSGCEYDSCIHNEDRTRYIFSMQHIVPLDT